MERSTFTIYKLWFKILWITSYRFLQGWFVTSWWPDKSKFAGYPVNKVFDWRVDDHKRLIDRSCFSGLRSNLSAKLSTDQCPDEIDRRYFYQRSGDSKVITEHHKKRDAPQAAWRPANSVTRRCVPGLTGRRQQDPSRRHHRWRRRTTTVADSSPSRSAARSNHQTMQPKVCYVTSWRKQLTWECVSSVTTVTCANESELQQ